MTSEVSITVIKRNGSKEPLEIEKFDKVCQWAVEDIKGVSSSELALRTYDRLYDGITTKEIHETLISTAAELITEKTPNYDKVASRLISFGLKKEVFGSVDLPPFREIVNTNISKGVYTAEYNDWYSSDQLDEIGNVLDDSHDDLLCYAGMEQFRRKYIVQDRSAGILYETPQVRYAAISAAIFSVESPEKRLEYVKRYYKSISTHRNTIPTPIAAGVGTPVKQFSSCVLVPAGDDLKQINQAASTIVEYASKKAGIGVDVGRIRAIGAKVGRGEVRHTGVIPFIKYFKGALKSCVPPDTYVEILIEE